MTGAKEKRLTCCESQGGNCSHWQSMLAHSLYAIWLDWDWDAKTTEARTAAVRAAGPCRCCQERNRITFHNINVGCKLRAEILLVVFSGVGASMFREQRTMSTWVQKALFCLPACSCGHHPPDMVLKIWCSRYGDPWWTTQTCHIMTAICLRQPD